MFWNKKDDRQGLPDLPPIKSPFSKELTVSKVDIPQPSQEQTAESHPLPTFPDSPSDKGFSQSAIKDAVSDVKEENPFLSTDDSSQGERSIKSDEVEAIVDQPEDNNEYETSINMMKDKPSLPVVQQTSIYSKESSFIMPEIKPQKEPAFQSEIQFSQPSNNLSLGLPPEEEKPVPKVIEKPRPLEKIVVRPVEKPISQTYERPMPPIQKSNEIFVKIDKFQSAKKSIASIRQQVDQIDDLLRKIRETKLKEERELSNWEKEIMSVKEKIREINDNLFDKAL